ncbi:MAG: hypothetical protein GEV08_23780, partial [Acidimicrobiia bacterium]|nr:hypothetical protein [Acidimicrobiia bacterium]
MGEPAAFDPAEFDAFHYEGVDLDPATGTAAFRYALRGGRGRVIPFTERLTFSRPWPTAPARAEAAGRLVRLLHLVAGVSYYKAALPRRLVVHDAVAPSAAELGFTERTYRAGLAELLYRNDLGLDLPLELDVATPGGPQGPLGPLGNGPLVPVGGGKDSATSIELVRAAGRTPLLFSLNRYEPITRTAQAAGLQLVTTERRLDPMITELNRAGARNGHVPVTAITSLTALIEAVLHGRDEVVMSNERSASAPTLFADGAPVNHQYSKSFAFEADLAGTLAGLLGDGLSSFSLLRPLSELAILAVFSRYGRYHEAFTSCNRVFRLDPARRATSWCGDCDKCRFVALGLAPFLERSRVTAIMGRDVLDDPAQLPGFRELLGLAGERPFECVGTIEECRVALHLAAARPDHQTSCVVRTLAPEVHVTAEQVRETFTPAAEH